MTIIPCELLILDCDVLVFLLFCLLARSPPILRCIMSALSPLPVSLRAHFKDCHGLRFLFLNVNSLLLKIHELEWYVGSARIDVLGLAETKVDDSISDSSISIPGFELFRRDRNRHGGGVALYARSTLQPTLECSHSDLEALVVKLCKPNIYFTVTYLPPSCPAA